MALSDSNRFLPAFKCSRANKAGFTSRIFEVDFASVTLNDLDLINGHVSGISDDGDGGAVEDFIANLTVNNCSFSGNAALNGGAIADAGGNLTVNNCAFSTNTANASGNTPGIGGAIAAYPLGTLTTAYPTVSITTARSRATLPPTAEPSTILGGS